MKKILKYEQAMKLSLENAERFIEDAKILIQNSSFGHALALSIFGDGEIAKSYVCWFVANKLIPASSIVVKEVFIDHYTKHENQSFNPKEDASSASALAYYLKTSRGFMVATLTSLLNCSRYTKYRNET